MAGLSSVVSAIFGEDSKWGIWKEKDVTAAISFSSFLGIEIRKEAKVVSAPVEEGSFVAYNKVMQPFGLTCTVGVEGEDSELQKVLTTLDELQKGIDLLTITTPYGEFTNVNLVEYNYAHKREEGIGVLWLELKLQEVKQVESTTTTATVAYEQNVGVVQTEESFQYKINNTVSDVVNKFTGSNSG